MFKRTNTATPFPANRHVVSKLAVVGTSATDPHYYRLTHADMSIEYFDIDGKLRSAVDAEGFTQTFVRAGNLLTVTDHFGRALTVTYDGSNRVQSIAVPGGASYGYGYETRGNLNQVQYLDPGFAARQYQYHHATHLYALTDLIDENGAPMRTGTTMPRAGRPDGDHQAPQRRFRDAHREQYRLGSGRVSDVIEKILAQLNANAPEHDATRRPPVRALPQRGLFDETGQRHENQVWVVLSAARQRPRLAACTQPISATTPLTRNRVPNGVSPPLHYSERRSDGYKPELPRPNRGIMPPIRCLR